MQHPLLPQIMLPPTNHQEWIDTDEHETYHSQYRHDIYFHKCCNDHNNLMDGANSFVRSYFLCTLTVVPYNILPTFLQINKTILQIIESLFPILSNVQMYTINTVQAYIYLID